MPKEKNDLIPREKMELNKQQIENSVKDIVVKAISEKYPHYTGSIVFKKIPDEFASSARLISITDELDSKRSFKYLMASSETKVVEVYNVTDRLKDFLPVGFTYSLNLKESTMYIIDDKEEDYLQSNLVEQLFKLPSIDKIIKILKKQEKHMYTEYCFSDFYNIHKMSVRAVELELLKRKQGDKK